LKKKAKFIPAEGPYEPSADTKSTMLGEAQWQWLEQQLKQPAQVRILVSSIQVVAQDHHHEKWFNLPHERERLYKLLRDTKAAGLFIISGDRHLAELSLMDAGLGYPLYDLTSSGLNQGFPRWRKLETNRHRVATMNQGNNFGLIAIDWDKKDPQLSLQIRDEQGDITIQEKLGLSTLQPGVIKTKPPGRVVLADGTPLTDAEVKNRLGKEVTIVLEVQASGAAGGLIFLNSSAERGDDSFTVVLDTKAQAQFKADGVADPRKHFEGKTIRVTGTLSLFRERPQIMVSAPAQIRFEKANSDPGNP
jgi:alkaline phosphatase D